MVTLLKIFRALFRAFYLSLSMVLYPLPSLLVSCAMSAVKVSCIMHIEYTLCFIT